MQKKLDEKEDKNVKPSELFNSGGLNNGSNTTEADDGFKPGTTGLDINSIPTREEEKLNSPALYQGENSQQGDYYQANQSSSRQDADRNEKYKNLDIQTMRKFLLKKDDELREVSKSFKEIRSFVDTLKIEKENLETQVETLKSKIEMKDTQIETLKDTIEMKNQQIDMKNDKIDMKEEQMQAYKSSLEEKKRKIEQLKSESVEMGVFEETKSKLEEKNALIEEKNETIQNLEEEAKMLSQDLAHADEEIERLHTEISNLKESSEQAVFLNPEQVKNRIREILHNSLHNVNLTVPNITDLLDLDIFEVKSSVNLKISCYIDSSDPQEEELVEEFSVFDNISLRIYDEKDRYTILADGANMFFAAKGLENDRYLTFSTQDSQHIKIFNALILETWLRARKI